MIAACSEDGKTERCGTSRGRQKVWHFTEKRRGKE